MANDRRVELIAQLLPRVAARRQEIDDSERIIGQVDGFGSQYDVEARDELVLAKYSLDHSLHLFSGIFHGGQG